MKRIRVRINDEQYEALKEFADNYSCTPADILGSYVADLVQVDSNGSDERAFARQYFDRTHLAFNWSE